MTTVRFSLPATMVPALAARVPIEILDRNLVQVGRCFSEGAMELPAGAFAARAVLPDGNTVIKAFEIVEREAPYTVDLLSEPATAASSTDSAPASAAIPAADAGPGEMAEGAVQPVTALRVRLHCGDPFADSLETGAWQDLAIGDELEIAGRDKPQLLEVENPPLMIVVPVIAGDSRIMSVIDRGDGAATPHMNFRNQDLEILLLYSGRGLSSQVRQLVSADTELAVKALNAHERRPIASAAGAYALLNAGDLDELRPWVHAFPESYPQVADAWIVCAEVVARSGDHAAAFANLAMVREAGLPFLSAGLSHALDRLRQYQAMATEGRLDVDEATAKAMFTDLLPRLLWISMRTDYERPLLSFAPPVAPPQSSWLWTFAVATAGVAAAAVAGVGAALHLRRSPSQPATERG